MRMSNYLGWERFFVLVAAAILMGAPWVKADDLYEREEMERYRQAMNGHWNDGDPSSFALPLPPVGAMDRYAVIVYSPSTKKCSHAEGYLSLSSTRRLAMITGRTPDARAVAWVKNGFCALAVGKDGSYAAGYAATLPEAKAMALKKCSQRSTDCEIAACTYSGRPQGGSRVEGGDETTANARRARR